MMSDSDDHSRVCGTAMAAAERMRLGNGDAKRGRVVLCEREVTARRQSHPGSFELAEALIELAQAHRHAGDDEATERACVDGALAILGAIPRSTAWLRGYAVSGLLHRLVELDDRERARTLNDWMFALCETRTLDQPGDVGWQTQHRPSLLERRAQLASGAEAERLSRIALAAALTAQQTNRAHQRGHLGIAMAMRNLAIACDANGNPAEAAQLLTDAAAEVRRQYDDNDGMWFDAPYLADLARMLRKLGQPAAAADRFSEAVGRYERTASWFQRTGDLEAMQRFVTSADQVRRELCGA